jgi:hypothetical protein
VTVVAFLIGALLGSTATLAVGWHHYAALRFDRRIWETDAHAKTEAAEQVVDELDIYRGWITAIRLSSDERSKGGLP